MGLAPAAALALLAQTKDRGELADCVNVLNDALNAFDLAGVAAEKAFTAARSSELAASVSAAQEAAIVEVSARHAAKPVEPKGKK